MGGEASQGMICALLSSPLIQQGQFLVYRPSLQEQDSTVAHELYAPSPLAQSKQALPALQQSQVL